MKNIHLMIALLFISIVSCQLEEHELMTIHENEDLELGVPSTQDEAVYRSQDSEASAFVDVFNCLPNSYWIRLVGFGLSVEVKYRIMDMESNTAIDSDHLFLTDNNDPWYNIFTSEVLEECKTYRVLVKARNTDGSDWAGYNGILNTQCNGYPTC